MERRQEDLYFEWATRRRASQRGRECGRSLGTTRPIVARDAARRLADCVQAVHGTARRDEEGADIV